VALACKLRQHVGESERIEIIGLLKSNQLLDDDLHVNSDKYGYFLLIGRHLQEPTGNSVTRETQWLNLAGCLLL
jgi:hypothetical protein